MNFGPELKRLRKERGWTQAQVAEKAELGHSYYSKLEKGTRLPAKPEQLVRLSEAFGVGANHFGTLEGLRSDTAKANVLKVNGATVKYKHEREGEGEGETTIAIGAGYEPRLRITYAGLAPMPDGEMPPIRSIQTTFRVLILADGTASDKPRVRRRIQIKVFPPPDIPAKEFMTLFNKVTDRAVALINDSMNYTTAVSLSLGCFVTLRERTPTGSLYCEAWAPGMQHLRPQPRKSRGS